MPIGTVHLLVATYPDALMLLASQQRSQAHAIMATAGLAVLGVMAMTPSTPTHQVAYSMRLATGQRPVGQPSYVLHG